jgi:surface antigen
MALCLLAAILAGCASDEDAHFTPMPRESSSVSVSRDDDQAPLQCVPYAREHSDVKIYGDAWTWWDKAAGKYPQSSLPQSGAVMVLTGYAGPERGHVAVVSKIVSAREIRVDHANWLDDGSIYLNDPVEDVSTGNDWSQVRVYNLKTGGWGSRIYPVQGFIGGSGGDSLPSDNDRVSDARKAPAHDGLASLVARADIPKNDK